MNDNEHKLGRRQLLQRSLIVLAASPVLAACSGGSGGLTCTDTAGLDPTAIANRNTQQYVDHSLRASQHCSACRFYTAGAPNTCGRCQVIAGPINPDGYCNLFSAAG